MDYKVTDTELTNVANAIRAKGSTSAPLTWESGFASAISAIPTGITPSGTMSITSNGIYDVTNYASADVNVSGGGSDTRFADLVQRTISGDIEDSAVTDVGLYAFYTCSALTGCSFPSATRIRANAFYSATSLSTCYVPMVQRIDNMAFYGCYALKSVNMPSLTEAGSSVFQGCSNLSKVEMSSLSKIEVATFSSCINLEETSFPLVTFVGSSAFYGCQKLSTISLPKAYSIYSSAFQNCYNLLSLYLMGSTVVKLSNINALSSTPIRGYTTSTGGVYGSIFVPSSLYSSYIVATAWSMVSARFVSV